MGAARETQIIAAPTDPTAGAPRAEPDDPVRLRLWGVLTTATATGVRELFRTYVGMGCCRLLVDLEAVEAIDAAGIATLLDGRRHVEAAGGAFYLRAGAVVDAALRRTGTVSAFRLWPDAEA